MLESAPQFDLPDVGLLGLSLVPEVEDKGVEEPVL